MKNILLMCLSKSGAAPAFILSIANGFNSNKNNRVYCIVSSGIENRQAWNEAGNRGIKVLFIETGNTKTFFISTIKFLAVGKKQVEEFISGKCISVSMQTLTHPWMYFINKWVNPKHNMVVVHDPEPHSGEKKVNTFISRFMYRYTPEVIVMTKKFIPVVEKIYKKKKENIYYMYHGIYDNYHNMVSVPEMSGFKFRKYNLVFFGRIEEYKGIDVLIKAYSKICQSYKDITLTIAGNGDIRPYVNQIKDLPEINIINRYIRDEEIGTLFSIENEIIVLPYKDATQSGVIPVAVDFNVPVVATNTGGLVEQLNNGNLGVFANPDDENSLVYAILKYIRDEEFFRKQKIKMNEFKKEIQWSQITEKLLSEIDSRESYL